MRTEEKEENVPEFCYRHYRSFLRFRYEKHTVPQRKTYGSHGGNIRFAKGKHKNYGNITRFSTRGFLKNLAPYTQNNKQKRE